MTLVLPWLLFQGHHKVQMMEVQIKCLNIDDMKFGTLTFMPPSGMNCNNSGRLLAFHLEASSGHYFNVSSALYFGMF